jgi:hypothetical protein
MPVSLDYRALPLLKSYFLDESNYYFIADISSLLTIFPLYLHFRSLLSFAPIDSLLLVANSLQITKNLL